MDISASWARKLEIPERPFPLDAFPDGIREIIEETNASLGFITDFTGAAILAATSVAIGNTRVVQLKRDFQQPAILWVALVGNPGVNKTALINWVFRPLRNLDSRNYRDYKIAENAEIAYNKLSEKEKREISQPDEAVLKQIMLNDATLEASLQALNSNPKGCICTHDELSSWLKNQNRYNKGSDLEYYLSIWSGQSIAVNRVKGNSRVENPFLSIIGGIQPSVTGEITKHDNGFMERFLFSFPSIQSKAPWTDKQIDSNISRRWQVILEEIANQEVRLNEYGQPIPFVIEFDEDARRHLFAWQSDLTSSINNTSSVFKKSAMIKMEVLVMRLALSLQILRDSNSSYIGIESLHGAIQLAEYFLNSAYRVKALDEFSNPIANLDADKRRLYEALPDNFTTKLGKEIALEVIEMPGRTFDDFLKNQDLFQRKKHGEYQKVA